jgi:hypothetical protein
MSAWKVISHVEVPSGGQAAIDFNSIPNTYTDLCLVVSGRSTADEAGSGSFANLKPNNTTSSQSMRTLRGTGSTAASNSESTIFFTIAHSGTTSNTFGNSVIYIPNYAGSTNKSVSIDGVNENNATAARQEIAAGLYSSTSVISSLNLTPGGGSFVQYSSATLYGITKGSSGGVIATSVPPLFVEYLVIAGGGGGGDGIDQAGGGGGAGGYRSSITGESSGGGASAESALSLALGTNYSVTIGAGGSGSGGSNSIFATITSTGGGKGANKTLAGSAGGSGGGAGGTNNTMSGGAGTANQGYAGGSNGGQAYRGGGGGGAGSVGQTATSATSTGHGGSGVTSSVTGTAVARAGGGGGAGGAPAGGTATAGGGGARGNGTANTGGGAGGYLSGEGNGQTSGGSGIVVLRYPSTFTITIGAGLTGSTSTVGANKVTTITAGTGNVSWAV